MKGLFHYPSTILAAGNAILLLIVWQFLVTDTTQQHLAPAMLTRSKKAQLAPFKFGAVTRRVDPAVGRLFASHQAEAPAFTKPVEPVQPVDAVLRLVGVILPEEADGKPVALVEYGAPARIARLRAGDQIDPSGWSVETISQSAIVILKKKERHVLSLD